MDHDGQEPLTESELVMLAEDLLRARLPGEWSIDAVAENAVQPAVDAIFGLTDPAGATAQLIIEVKRSAVGRDVDSLSRRLQHATAAAESSNPLPMVVSRFLSEPVRQALTARGINYLDATGNLRLESRIPGLFLRDVGAASDPWRKRGRPRESLRGQPAALVVRALVDFQPPYSVPQLVHMSGSSNGATYRVVNFLDEQALLRRDKQGRVVDVSWRQLLEAWSRDYSFYKSNRVSGYLAPRGLDQVINALRELGPSVDPTIIPADSRSVSDWAPVNISNSRGLRYAVTGSYAAAAYAPYAPTRTLTLYTNSRGELSERLHLRAVDTGANVMMAHAAYDVAFRRLRPWQHIWVVPPSQAAVDLMTGPGRNPAEAQELLDWMERDELSWRLVPS